MKEVKIKLNPGAIALWSNQKSIDKRNQSHRDTWNKRKRKNVCVWSDDAKKAFSIAKCRQYDNKLGLYLIENNIPIWHPELKNVIRTYVSRCKKGYKNYSNKINQAKKICDKIKEITSIDIHYQSIINY